MKNFHHFRLIYFNSEVFSETRNNKKPVTEFRQGNRKRFRFRKISGKKSVPKPENRNGFSKALFGSGRFPGPGRNLETGPGKPGHP